MQKPGCVVYSFGSNGQVTFEEAVVDITRKHCEVYVFEFTLSAEQEHTEVEVKWKQLKGFISMVMALVRMMRL